MMMDDLELLSRYTAKRDESAFSALVARYIDLVYSTALRRLHGNAALAEETTQSVFTDLAAKAAALGRHESLAAWLHKSACFAASKVNRSEQRRRLREEKAVAMAEPMRGDDEPAWDDLREVIDEALHELKDADRQAVLLRYFSGEKLAQVGSSMGVSENAARMRIERALEQLREALGKRGITSTSSGLAAALGLAAIQQAPAGLAAAVSATVLTTTAAAAPATTLIFLTMSKAKLAAVAVLGIVAVTVPVRQQQTIDRLANENAQLTSQLAEQRTAPPPVAASPAQESLRDLEQLTVDKVELERLKSAEAQWRRDVARLRDSASGKTRAEIESAELRQKLKEARATDAFVTNAMTRGLATAQRWKEQRAEKEVRAMTEALGLSEEQAAAVRAIKLSAIERETEFIQERLLGKTAGPVAVNHGANAEAEIKALLSPEQLAAYPQYKEADKLATLKEAVDSELAQLKNSLALSPAQADKLGPVLERIIMQPPGAAADMKAPASGAEMLEQRAKDKIAAMEGILTPSQIESFRKAQEDQLEMVRAAEKLFQKPEAPVE